MTQGKWAELSAAQKTWSRWKAGQSLHEIGRAFGKGHSSIRFLLWHPRWDCSRCPPETKYSFESQRTIFPQ
jgi:hypothetical protein